MNDLTHAYMATLTFGLTYVVVSPKSGTETVFTKDNAVPVSEEMKRYLEAQAVDEIAVFESSGEKSHRTRCKFTFHPITKRAA